MNEINKKAILSAIEEMKAQGVVFDAGLTDEEINQIESIFDISFPPDLKFFYQNSLPISTSSSEETKLFPTWRQSMQNKEKNNIISDFSTWVFEGICFDIEQNNFWMKEWGEKPTTLEAQIETARQKFEVAPKLIPIYQHRCMPSSSEVGNPVFSIWQTDIIYYGMDLVSYLKNEFKLSFAYDVPKEPKKVHFWDEMIEINNSI